MTTAVSEREKDIKNAYEACIKLSDKETAISRVCFAYGATTKELRSALKKQGIFM